MYYKYTAKMLPSRILRTLEEPPSCETTALYYGIDVKIWKLCGIFFWFFSANKGENYGSF